MGATEETGSTTPEVAADAEAALSLGNRARNAAFRWYVVHTYSMFEEKAKSTLLDRIKRDKMEAKFGDIIVPKTAQETVLKSGKKKKVERIAYYGLQDGQVFDFGSRTTPTAGAESSFIAGAMKNLLRF